VFQELQSKLGLPERCRVAVQGFGNAGLHAAHLWAEAGHTLVAASDSKGAIHKADGIDPAALEAHKKTTGSVVDFLGANNISNTELLTCECDVLIPAALENQITKENAQAIKAKVVFELANGPTSVEADDMLFARGVPVVPDILANSGGVTGSYFEWEQNLKGEHWSEAEVFAKLKPLMQEQARAVFDRATAASADLRRGAFILALERLAAATK
jgi:glutamate dehydrogenase (NADP+)